jgi:hypothetical protein
MAEIVETISDSPARAAGLVNLLIVDQLAEDFWNFVDVTEVADEFQKFGHTTKLSERFPK